MSYRVFVRNWWKRGPYGQLRSDACKSKWTWS